MRPLTRIFAAFLLIGFVAAAQAQVPGAQYPVQAVPSQYGAAPMQAQQPQPAAAQPVPAQQAQPQLTPLGPQVAPIQSQSQAAAQPQIGEVNSGEGIIQICQCVETQGISNCQELANKKSGSKNARGNDSASH